MATHCHLWLEYAGDWRGLRDFFFDACRCTRFWTGPMTRQEGRPDDQEREYYGVYNDYNLIGLLGPRTEFAYKNDVRVSFTFNGRSASLFRDWRADVINASIGWIARTAGDVLLDLDGLPLLARKAGGPITVNDLAGRKEDWAQRPEYEQLIVAGLQREGLSHQMGLLDPI